MTNPNTRLADEPKPSERILGDTYPTREAFSIGWANLGPIFLRLLDYIDEQAAIPPGNVAQPEQEHFCGACNWGHAGPCPPKTTALDDLRKVPGATGANTDFGSHAADLRELRLVQAERDALTARADGLGRVNAMLRDALTEAERQLAEQIAIQKHDRELHLKDLAEAEHTIAGMREELARLNGK